VITALGHGKAVISMFFSSTALIRAYQGSEIPGVPASDISATSFPFSSISIILSTFACPECEW
jgi:hypothetical protein